MNVVRIVWFVFGGIGCFMGGIFMTQIGLNDTQYTYSVSTFTYLVGIACFVTAVASCLTSCGTGAYWFLHYQELQHRRGRPNGITTYSFALFRSGKLIALCSCTQTVL